MSMIAPEVNAIAWERDAEYDAWLVGCRPIGGGAADHEVRRFALVMVLNKDGWRWAAGQSEPRRCPFPDCAEKLT